MVMHAKQSTPLLQKMHSLLAAATEYIVLDLETSGLSPNKGGRIIEIGACKVRDGRIVETFSELINPELKISQKITDITGITNEMLTDKRVYGQSLPQLYHWMDGLPVVCHNASFDWSRYLLHYFRQVGIEPTNEAICTMKLAKMYMPGKDSYKLNLLADEFKISLNHHRALDDAKATARIAHIFQHRFANEFERVPVSLPEPTLFTKEEFADSYQIKQVSYWEKRLSPSMTMKRIYVQTTMGSVFYDKGHDTWYTKDMAGNVNFDEVEERVMRFIRVKDRDALQRFSGTVS